MKQIFVIISFVLAGINASAQDQKEEVIRALKTLTEKYSATPMLSFDVHYRYASQDAPGIYLDSLNGACKMNGARFWYMIDQTQTMFNGEYAVAVYKEDSIIYLSRSVAGSNPLNIVSNSMDSVLAEKNIRYSLSSSGKTKVLTFDFVDDPQFKTLRYEIDQKTGFLKKMTQVVNAAQMLDAEAVAQLKGQESYSIIETIFDNYRTGQFSADIFNITKYVQKEGDEYHAALPYQSFKVFLGSSNL